MWIGARRSGNAQRGRQAHQQADLALLDRHGIASPPTAWEGVSIGQRPLMAFGVICTVLIAVLPAPWNYAVEAAGATLIIALFTWPSGRYHQAQRRRAMTRAHAVIAELPPDERKPLVEAFQRLWRGRRLKSL
jgi:hypothetical protein